jgi:hypothetical protein
MVFNPKAKKNCVKTGAFWDFMKAYYSEQGFYAKIFMCQWLKSADSIGII